MSQTTRLRLTSLFFVIIFATLVLSVQLPVPKYHRLPSLRQQAKIQDAWRQERINNVIPALLNKYNIDLWIVSQREYAGDTVFWSLKPATTFAARRRTLQIFERVTQKRLWGLLQQSTTVRVHTLVDNTDQIWSDLRSAVDAANPKTIVLNIDSDIAFADGLHAGEREAIELALGEHNLAKVTREPRLAVELIETRVKAMIQPYKEVMETVHAMITEAFSDDVIVPHVTTTEDVVWWFRERIQAQNMTTWFQPIVDVFRRGDDSTKPNEAEGTVRVILPGDILWCDVGVVAYGLATDTQHLGYVLRDGEDEVPEGIHEGLRSHANVMQDIVKEEIKVERTGNEILASSLERINEKGITGTVYSHPIGDWGHSAGPLIGMVNLQESIPGKGDLKVIPNSWFSVELQALVPIPEWDGQVVPFRLEEDIYVDETGANHWVYRRQEEMHIVDWQSKDVTLVAQE
ncbi:xaa-Pro aminopeptidase family enzyme [Jimgerdemannia flammicorona]|uniref:Xaa-Pro aminopeptidase family enzyme n=1 Tax=Jimgerdemannia flammicorona TaxID=994334 RepID=A0A433QYH4_9FUNG|nr:xaa-Pro aminopeptidase family enzyme [Jimgerdemannia flammicorona]